MGIRVYIYSRVRRNVKSQFFPNRMVWWLDLATGLSREFKPRANELASLGLLSCNATTGMTLQLPCMLHTCANFGGLPVVSHPQVQPRVSASLHNLEHFFTISHSLPLHDSHLNTRLLITKIQVNLAWNKTNKIVDKIQPYISNSWSCSNNFYNSRILPIEDFREFWVHKPRSTIWGTISTLLSLKTPLKHVLGFPLNIRRIRFETLII